MIDLQFVYFGYWQSISYVNIWNLSRIYHEVFYFCITEND